MKGPGLPPPPYNDQLYDIGVKATVTGFLTPAQRTAARVGLAAAAAAFAGLVFGRAAALVAAGLYFAHLVLA